MLSKLWDLLVGSLCDHKWTIIRDITVSDDIGQSWTRYHLQCQECGDVKVKDMK